MPLSSMPIYRIASTVLVFLFAFILAGCGTTTQKNAAHSPSSLTVKPAELLREVSFAALPGWESDNLREAWPAFIASCSLLAKNAVWAETCAASRKVETTDVKAIRTFFEYYFAPHQLINEDGSGSGLMTGYYEPLLRGARKRGGDFQTPIYRKPDDLLTIELASIYPELKGIRLRGRLVGKTIAPYPSRAEISSTNKLSGKEILWVDDPIDAFFLHVQGSGRVQIVDTHEIVRVAYADQNGHPYKSIGRYLVDKGEISLEQASAQNIKVWFAANPSRQQELLNANPSYVFFKEEKITRPELGPKGALGVPLTAQRSIAVDPSYVSLGTPVYIATTDPVSKNPLQRLTMAQDTGSAIKGANRVDYFWGFGATAGDQAGKTKQQAKIWMLLPKR
jgi:membrane-bound lytic murein transglycosylase A